MSDAYSLGINATPTVVINGTPLPAPDLATVSSAIDRELEQLVAADAGDEGPAGDG
jgi:protein-disulfide isomerase